MPHISIAAETLFTIGSLNITNSLLTTYIVMAILVLGSKMVTKNLTLIPSNVQLIAESVVGGLFEFFKTVCGIHTKRFFPLIASLFLFILVSNWFGLLPGVGSIGIKNSNTHSYIDKVMAVEEIPGEFNTSQTNQSKEASNTEQDHPAIAESPALTPLFRAPTADLNTTIALALISVIAIQYYGFKIAGVHYVSRFVDVTNPINFFVGILELISEVSKIISFAFRLFGNVFAGEVLLVIISTLITIPLLLPIPVIGLELFVGFIQAFVFSMLTAVFLNVAVSHGQHAAREEVSDHG